MFCILKHTLFIAFLIITLDVAGQKHFVGGQGGVNITNILPYQEIESEYKTGISSGLSYDLLLKKHFSLGTGLLYNQRGFIHDLVYTDENADSLGIVTNVFSYNYISLPIKTGLTLGNKLNAFFNIGVMPSFLVNANQKAPQLNNDGTIRDKITIEENSSIRKFDLAGLAELGVSYKFFNSYCLFTACTYQQSLTAVRNSAFFSDRSDLRHRGWMLTLGMRYQLSKE